MDYKVYATGTHQVSENNNKREGFVKENHK
jgi:hypothetical protein